MTNEEAIKTLKGIFDWMKGDERWTDAEFISIEMGIKALEQDTVSRAVYLQCAWERDIAIEQLKQLGYSFGEKIRTDNDTISRQAAIDALERIFDRCEEIEVHLPEGDPDRTGYKMYPDYMTVWKYLRQLPSAQPKRKTGKWIYQSGLGWGETWICSECGEKTTSTIMGKPRYEWCPMCGADMRERRTDETD